jgi:hypothetical protein
VPGHRVASVAVLADLFAVLKDNAGEHESDFVRSN